MRVTIIEIDLPYCEHVYGESPCTASIGVTGAIKCFNSLRTCQDRTNFLAADKTLRFCAPTEECDYTENGDPVVVIPSIAGMSITPAIVNPGVDIGVRETVRITFDDHPHSDAGLDKYLSDRNYNPFNRGTFWHKLRARWPSLEGYPLRVRRGVYGEDLSTFTTYHYVIDSVVGGGDSVTIAAKDPLILTDKLKAQAPRLSSGVLAAAISDSDTAFTLDPVGIGDAEYPASGLIALAGKEIVSFTRSGDSVTITGRGLYDSEQIEHDEGTTAQIVLTYTGKPVSEIIYDLLTEYTPGFDPAWIDLDAWKEDVDEYINRFYSARIAKPTDVQKLLNELIEQVGLVMAWDSINQKLRLQPLRPVTTTRIDHNEDNIVADSFRITEQPQLRVSEVWTYYGQRNPLEDLNDPKNYKVGVASVDPNASADYPQPAIKQIFSRWIAETNRGAALQVNASILARYRDAPRKFQFISRDITPPTLGTGARIEHWHLQDETGAKIDVPIQYTSVNASAEDSMQITAQEVVFVEQPDTGGGTGSGGTGARYVYIDAPAFAINLRVLFDELYPPPLSGDEVKFLINAPVGGIPGTDLPAVDVGDWPSGVILTMTVNSPIRGYGGNGGRRWGNLNGTDGGMGLYTRFPINVINNADISGGGGGGATRIIELIQEVRIGGKGGEGNPQGIDGDGTTEAMVRAGLGEDGQDQGEITGGKAGIAIDGISYVSLSGSGAVNGLTVN